MYQSQSRPTLLQGIVETVKRDIEDVLHTDEYYYTPEIVSELNNLNNGLEHLKLDKRITNTSADWDRKFNPRETDAATRTVASILDKTSSAMLEYKRAMLKRSIASKQENEVREIHHWAVQTLRQLQKELFPFTYGAADRIRQFSDHVGVTDRFTGYRHNLTRTSREAEMVQSRNGLMDSCLERSKTWAYNPTPQEDHGAMGSRIKFGSAYPYYRDTKGYQTVDSVYPKTRTSLSEKPLPFSQKLETLKAMNDMNASQSGGSNMGYMDMSRGPHLASVQEQAGINTTYPGITEYKKRYTRPPMDIPTSHFTINPTPDLMLNERPLGLESFESSFTEYQTRYEWPDGNKIERHPWLRK
ncbi:hypothetical protein ScPMuIL_011812 [Solemya velum]